MAHQHWHIWFGAGMGVLIPVVGVATAVTMARFDINRKLARPAHRMLTSFTSHTLSPRLIVSVTAVPGAAVGAALSRNK